MTLKEFKQRIDYLKDPEFVFQLCKKEITGIYASILYYMAMETVVDTGHTRELWVKAIEILNNNIAKEVPIPNYDIWKKYYFKDGKKESDNIQISFNSKGFTVRTDDEVWQSENLNVAYPPRSNKYVDNLLRIRKLQYRGILGTNYQEFYVDRVLNIIENALKGSGDNRVYLFIFYIRQYVKRVKTYLEQGK